MQGSEPGSPSSRGVWEIAFDALVIFDLTIVARRAEELFPTEARAHQFSGAHGSSSTHGCAR